MPPKQQERLQNKIKKIKAARLLTKAIGAGTIMMAEDCGMFLLDYISNWQITRAGCGISTGLRKTFRTMPASLTFCSSGRLFFLKKAN